MAADPENTLKLETTKGDVVIEMRPDLAPGHVARIKELVRDGFYDGIVFHRVIDGFMAQTGCPQGTGTGGSGKKLKAEFNAEPHVRGTMSMARAQSPDSGDSQFFICFDDAPFLNKQYTVWGKVIPAWRMSTRSSAASRCAIPTRSSRRRSARLPEWSFRGAAKARGRRACGLAANPESKFPVAVMDSGVACSLRPGIDGTMLIRSSTSTCRPSECAAACPQLRATQRG